MMRRFLVLLIVMAGCGLPTTELDRVQALFTRYQELQTTYDPALADLYHDDASVTTVLESDVEPDETHTLTGRELKAKIGDIVAEAQSSGDRFTYPDATIKKVNADYKIFGQRRNEANPAFERYLIIVSQDSSGAWKIKEERVERQMRR